MRDETLEGTQDSSRTDADARAGIIVVFSGQYPLFVPLGIGGDDFIFGRGALGPDNLLPDERLSRRHAAIAFHRSGASASGTWIIRDLDSRNGTFVDGVRVHGEVSVPAPRVVRLGETLLVPYTDLGSAHAPYVGDDGLVIGIALRRALTLIERDAKVSPTLLIRGESGTGKELAARTFHAHGPHAQGPFVAVNCAAIPEGLAERLLFGTKRGAYSGAGADASGHIQNADGGVLFLDEGAELDLAVQAKLLRVLETQEVIPLGASRGIHVQLRVCVATHGDLRAAVAAGRFRADLYHRIAPPEVVLPPLRERRDEIAHHVATEIATLSKRDSMIERHPERLAHPLTAHAKLIEACLLRPWPGNVRELRKEIQHATLRADAANAHRVRLACLSPTAGYPFDAPHAAADPDGPEVCGSPHPTFDAEPDPKATRRSYRKWSASMSRERIERALDENAGNIAFAARSLGMQRTQMYREMARWSVKRPSRT